MASISNYIDYGTLTTDTDTATDSGRGTSCRGWATLSAHLASGAGTWTWQFRGPDGVWRSVYGGTDGTTEQVFTASHMVNVYFGDQVSVRANATAGTAPSWRWQIMSNPGNRPT